jgi:tetratricopeptide (TPR) repeat protein
VSNWLKRIADRLAKGPEHDGATHISDHFYKRSLYATSGEFLEALLEIFPENEALVDSDLHVLVTELRGMWGPEKAQEEGDLSEHVDFWKKLAARTSSPYAMACHADTLLLAGREAAAISVFLEVLELEPELLEELGEEIGEHARRIGGNDWLQFRLASLRVSIGGLADQDSDAIRELYSELLEEFSEDTAAVQEIRRLGEALEEAVERGEMPRAMVIRGPSRTSN